MAPLILLCPALLKAEQLALISRPVPIKGYVRKTGAVRPHIARRAVKPGQATLDLDATPAFDPTKPRPNTHPSVDVLDLNDMTLVKDKHDIGGCNFGGLYQDKEGTRWLVKVGLNGDAHAQEQARNEVLAGRLLAAAGLDVPEAKLIHTHGKHPTPEEVSNFETDFCEHYSAKTQPQTGVALRWIDGLHRLVTDEECREGQRGAAVDFWINSTDTSINYANLLTDQQGHTYRIDNEQSLRWTGGAALGTLDTDLALSAWMIFCGVYKRIRPDDFLVGVRQVAAVPDATIRDLCARFGPETPKDQKQLADALIARRDHIATLIEPLTRMASQKGGVIRYIDRVAIRQLLKTQ